MDEDVRRVVRTEAAPAAVRAYSQGVVANGFLFVSGQLPLDARDGILVAGGAADQARCSLANVLAVLEAGGASREPIVKATVLLSDIADFGVVNEVYTEWIGAGDAPARVAFQVGALPLGALVEVEVIAVVEKSA